MVVLNWYWFNPSSKFKTKTWSTPFTATSRETLVIWCIGVVIHGHVRKPLAAMWSYPDVDLNCTEHCRQSTSSFSFPKPKRGSDWARLTETDLSFSCLWVLQSLEKLWSVSFPTKAMWGQGQNPYVYALQVLDWTADFLSIIDSSYKNCTDPFFFVPLKPTK